MTDLFCRADIPVQVTNDLVDFDMGIPPLAAVKIP